VEFRGQRSAELLGVARILQDEGTLDVRATVASGGELEMPLADGAYRFQQPDHFFGSHGAAARDTKSSANRAPRVA
jgi:hypothetical protein